MVNDYGFEEGNMENCYNEKFCMGSRLKIVWVNTSTKHKMFLQENTVVFTVKPEVNGELF